MIRGQQQSLQAATNSAYTSADKLAVGCVVAPDLEGVAEDVDLTPEPEPALARDGNGNGWKKA